MGTKMAPSYENLFMGVLEDRMINSYAYKPLVYLRYIDDIFMIWTEGEENLNGFLSHCNQINKDIQLEQVASKEKIPFLDVSVIYENGKLHTNLYIKPTDKHQYLYSHSYHPKHTKNSLPYCLLLSSVTTSTYMFQRNVLQSTRQRNGTSCATKSSHQRRCNQQGIFDLQRRCRS